MAAGCSKPAPASKSYTVIGQILAVHPDRQSLTIKHGDIAGYMPGMTMTFIARDRSLVDGRTAGEMVKATLEVGDTWSRLTTVEVTGKEPITAMPAELALAEGLLTRGDPLPPVSLVDQKGRPRTIGEWRGAPVAITFTYTRCPMPEFCPRVDRQFADVQAGIASDPVLNGKARLLTISFDPEYDKPAVLAAHAHTLRADARVWTFATGTQREIELFAARFGVAVTRSGATAADIMHNLQTIVVDSTGTIRAVHSGSEWTPAQILDDLRRAH